MANSLPTHVCNLSNRTTVNILQNTKTTGYFLFEVINIMKVILLALFCLLLAMFLVRSSKEGFSYNDCRSKGFSKEFCVTTPIAAQGTGICLCDNGSVGLQMPGFGGACVCNQGLYNPLYR